jgi:hypothetical protein
MADFASPKRRPDVSVRSGRGSFGTEFGQRPFGISKVKPSTQEQQVPWKAFCPGLESATTPHTLQRRITPGANAGEHGHAVDSLGPAGLTVSSPTDPAEREADALAAWVLTAPIEGAGPAPVNRASGPQIHRTCQACSEDEEKRDDRSSPREIRRLGNGTATVTHGIAAAVERLGGAGEPLPAGERRFFEKRFGYELSRVRVHTDGQAAETARALNAEAFTFRNDVAFAEGRYRPASDGGRRLLAHELAHVIQQGHALPLPGTQAPPAQAAGGAKIARQESVAAASTPVSTGPATVAPVAAAAQAPTSGGLIVEDDAVTLMPGQKRKTAFLAELRAVGCAAADQELARAGRNTEGCPFVEKWLSHYTDRPSSHLERVIRKLASGAATVQSAQDYIPLVAARMAKGVRTWVETGNIPSDIPEELRTELSRGGGALSSLTGAVGSAVSAIGGLFFKEGPGGARAGADVTALSARLGPGRPLEGTTRVRMESALGYDFSAVRIHDDAAAAGFSRALSAQAFTVGKHVAFAASSYQPSTPLGDALLAHELAHVAQQTGAGTPSAIRNGHAIHSAADPAVEEDADRAATGALAALYAPDLAPSDRGPRLRSGLRLSRCASGSQQAAHGKSAVQAAEKQAQCPDVDPRRKQIADSRLDDNARAVISAAQDGSSPLEERGPRLIRLMLEKYFADRASKVTTIGWKDDADGLEARPDQPGALLVGRYYVQCLNSSSIAKHVLQLGHELDHIDQYSTDLRFVRGRPDAHVPEREFLAFYNEATAAEKPGTGTIRHDTRVKMADEALGWFNCLSPDLQPKYRSKQQELLTLRVEKFRAKNGPPTDCPADMRARTH